MFIYSYRYNIKYILFYVGVMMVVIDRKGSSLRKLTYNDDMCLACGICADLCPTNSLELNDSLKIVRSQSNNDYISIDKEGCVLCGLCASACAFGGLDFEIDGVKSSELPNYPKWTHDSNINEEDCLFCGKCREACPQDSIFFKRKLPNRNDLLKGEISIKEEECLYCGICSEMCPAEAITLKSSNGKFLDIINVDEDKCVYCGVCKRACPQDAIKTVCSTCMYSDEFEVPKLTGDIFIEQKCINCGWCEDVCPADAVKVSKPFEGNLVTSEEIDCIGCESCKDICPCNAITIVDGKSVINEKYCVLCGACTKVCPEERLIVNRTSMKLTNICSSSWKAAFDSLLK